MITVLVLAAVVVCLGGLLVLALYAQLTRPRPVSLVEIEALVASPPPREVYGPMKRLFSEADFDFLASQADLPPARVQQLRQERRRVLQLYLCQLRGHFEQVYRACQLLTHRSHDPSFATQLTKTALSFYFKLVVLHLCCLLHLPGRPQIDVFDLVRPIQSLREALADFMGDLLARPSLVTDSR